MSNETFLLLIIIALVFISLPAWPYSKSWGYRSSGILTVILVVFLIWAIAGGRPLFRSSIGHDLRTEGRHMSDTIRHDVNE